MQLDNPLALAILAKQLSRQAQMVAFVNVYSFISWSFLAMLPLVLFLRVKTKKSVTNQLNI